jgi:glycosyltransferase involved in cell wall biosynthesis
VARSVDAVFEIIGDGPERASLEAAAGENVVFRGVLSHDEVLERIASATAVAVPSRWYEGFPVIIAEALSTATPLLVSRLGALPELVEDGVAGRVLAPRDAAAWSAAVRDLLTNPDRAAAFGAGARSAYERLHSEKINLTSLVGIYEAAIHRAHFAHVAKIEHS